MSRIAYAAFCALFTCGACSAPLPLAPTGDPPTDDVGFMTVEYPPPPAQVEVIVERPGPPCVWVDGHHRWEGRRWAWKPGAWVIPPSNCYYARARMAWTATSDSAGVLYYAPPQWYPVDPDDPDRKSARERCSKVEPCGAPIDD